MRVFSSSLICVFLVVTQFGSGTVWGQEKEATMSDLDSRIIDVVYKQSFSKNRAIRRQSLSVLSRNADLLRSLDEGNQLELVKSTIGDEDSDVVQIGMRILKNSEIEKTDRYLILMGLLNSKSDKISTDAFKALAENPDEVVKQIIATIENDLTGSHNDELHLIERFGPAAAAAVPVIVKSFNAKKKQAQASQNTNAVDGKTSGSQATLTFDYLPHLYAIAEIGPAAYDAMQIALAAAEEAGVEGRAEYPIAGLICIERILAGRSIAAKDDQILARASPSVIKRCERFVEAYFARADSDNDGIIDNTELGNSQGLPFNADRNRDGSITKREMMVCVAESTSSTSSSRSRKSSFRRTSARESVRIRLGNK